MTLRFFNTWSHALEEFIPIDPERVRVYACGPTVYGRIHIGNARMTVAFDVLYRLLQHVYGARAVTYVSNITDIEDKIIAAAGENLEAIADLTRRMTVHYHADRAALGCLPPDIEPHATEYVDGMIAMIERLIAGGHAYEAEGHVLFSVGSSPDYGRLSGRNRDDQIAGARVEVAPYKKDPADFVLWKPSSDNYPGWTSPWGRGRPGWHIECSVMHADTLGEEFDIHGGGIDLTFPHHENEIAQSRCAHGVVPARYWMHNGHVMAEGQKMSKSLGNFITVEDLLKRYPGEAIRMALLSAQYRQPLNVTEELLVASRTRLDYLYGVLRRRPHARPGGRIMPEVLEALSDDMNTPAALAWLTEMASGVDAEVYAPGDLVATAGLLGLLQQSPEAWFRWAPEGTDTLSEEDIAARIEARRAARAMRDFAAADRIRDELLAQGVALEDAAGNTTWKRI